jgi:hypothetical protein
MSPVVKAAFAYFVPVFAIAFALGTLRVTLIAPVTGPLLAVALEVPLVLALSWAVAGRVLRRWPLPPPARVRMGAMAFALLMLAELLIALAFGQTETAFLQAMTTLAGALGLAGQIGFGLIPMVRQPRG